MALRIRTFRIHDEATEQAVNAFLSDKRVHHWQASYSGDPSLGIWNLLIAYDDEQQRKPQERAHGQQRDGRGAQQQHRKPEPKPQPQKPEHIPDVPEAMMPLYENIRRWRNQAARDENVKPYILFDNKQLEGLVKAAPADIGALRALVPSMSAEHFEKYGNQLLGIMSAAASMPAA